MQTYSPAFRYAVTFILDGRIEGGFSDRPPAEDPGGKTNFGITHETLVRYVRDHPHEGFPADVRLLTRTQATEIYHEMFWDECRCGDLKPCLALVIFNAAVQSGPESAIRWLQRRLRIKDDGIFGPATIRAAWEADCWDLIPEYLTEQQLHNTSLRNWLPNRRGWTRRLFRVAIGAAMASQQLVTVEDVRAGMPAFQQDRNI